MAKELSARAEHLLGTQDEGLAFFVHEVRNPLAVIKGYACALENLDPDTDSNQIATTATAIQRAAGTLESIVSSLVAEGASVSRDIDLVEHETLISVLVEETVEDLRGVSNAHTLSVSIDDDAVVLVDPVRIRQVLMNLISNAVKFSPPRSDVDIIVGRRGDEIQVCVIDEGPGIPEDRVDELFRKFSRLGSTKNGSGLGLYISREIAVAHGGDLLLRDTVQGCRFSLLLPIHEGGR